MAASLEFEIEGLQGPRRLAERLQNVGARPFLIAASRVAMNQLRRRIQIEKAEPDGPPWAEWSDSYAATRGPEHSIGIDTGEMLGSVMRRIRGGDRVDIFPEAEHAQYFHKDRPLAGFGDEDVQQIEDVFALRIDALIEEAFA